MHGLASVDMHGSSSVHYLLAAVALLEVLSHAESGVEGSQNKSFLQQIRRRRYQGREAQVGQILGICEQLAPFSRGTLLYRRLGVFQAIAVLRRARMGGCACVSGG